MRQTRGTETSKYPEERTSTETPLVVASERGSAELCERPEPVWKTGPKRVKAPYGKFNQTYQVGRDT